MKRQIQTFLLALTLLVATGLVSCSNDNESNSKQQDGKETYARISLTQNYFSATTKAPADAHEAKGDEKVVNKATVYIFKYPANVLEASANLVFSGAQGATDPSDPVKMTTGQHLFYVVANAPATINATVGMSLDEFKKLIVDVANIDVITSPTPGFLITTIDTPPIENVVEATQAEAVAGTKNNFTFKVGRAMSKANLEFAPTTQVGTLSGVTYKMKAMPKKMYTMSNYDNATPKRLITPYFNETAPVDVAKYFDNATYVAADGTKPSYIMESSNINPLQGNAVYYSIKGTYVPVETVDKDGLNPQPGVAGSDFWRIRNKSTKNYTALIYREQPAASQFDPVNDEVAHYANGGETYYNYWVSNQALGVVPQAYDIVRNTYYYLTIISVAGPGEPDDIIDPNEPIIPEDAYITGKLEHLDWTVIDQQGGI